MLQVPKRKHHLQENKLDNVVNREPTVPYSTTSMEKDSSPKKTIPKVNLGKPQDHISTPSNDIKKKESKKDKEIHQNHYNLRRKIRLA